MCNTVRVGAADVLSNTFRIFIIIIIIIVVAFGIGTNACWCSPFCHRWRLATCLRVRTHCIVLDPHPQCSKMSAGL